MHKIKNHWVPDEIREQINNYKHVSFQVFPNFIQVHAFFDWILASKGFHMGWVEVRNCTKTEIILAKTEYPNTPLENIKCVVTFEFQASII